MTFYIDNDFYCHAEPGDDLREMESEFFDGRAEIIPLSTSAVKPLALDMGI